MRHVLLATREIVIHAKDVMPISDQPLAEMGSKKPASPRNKNFRQRRFPSSDGSEEHASSLYQIVLSAPLREEQLDLFL
jgi:hypothetical protein